MFQISKIGERIIGRDELRSFFPGMEDYPFVGKALHMATNVTLHG
jgi:hypothetical protein